MIMSKKDKVSVKKLFKKWICFFSLLFTGCLTVGFAAVSSTPQSSTPQSSVTIQPNDKTDDTTPQKGVDFSLQDDSMLGMIGQIKSFLGFDETHAAALELDGGSRVFRANGTYGLALNDDNRVKLTGEYLREDLDFEFFTGTTRQWVDQGAVGAAYQHLFDGDRLKGLEIGTHYSHAPSKNLSSQTIACPECSSGTLIDQRRIAGGDDWNGMAETALHLWRNSLLTVGGDYDRVRYDTEYCTQDGHDAQGFGGHARLEQLLKPNIQLEAQTTISQLFDSGGAGLNWIFRSTPTRALSTGVSSSYTHDLTTERSFWVNGINLNVVWDEAKKNSTDKLSYAPPELAIDDLTTWVQTPAVRMPDVLAITDECVSCTKAPPFNPITAVCPDGGKVKYSQIGNFYYAPGGWHQAYPTPLQTQSKAPFIAFDSANVTGTPAGGISCLYSIGLKGHDLILRNPRYTYATGTPPGDWIANRPSLYWPPSEPLPNSTCITSAVQCPFQTVAPV